MRRLAEWKARHGKKPVSALESKPKLHPDLEPLWNAWQTLNVGRPSGFSASGLPWVELSTFAADHGYEGPQRLRFCRIMRALDAAWLAEVAKMREKKRADSRSSRRSSGGSRRQSSG